MNIDKRVNIQIQLCEYIGSQFVGWYKHLKTLYHNVAD